MFNPDKKTHVLVSAGSHGIDGMSFLPKIEQKIRGFYTGQKPSLNVFCSENASISLPYLELVRIQFAAGNTLNQAYQSAHLLETNDPSLENAEAQERMWQRRQLIIEGKIPPPADVTPEELGMVKFNFAYNNMIDRIANDHALKIDSEWHDPEDNFVLDDNMNAYIDLRSQSTRGFLVHQFSDNLHTPTAMFFDCATFLADHCRPRNSKLADLVAGSIEEAQFYGIDLKYVVRVGNHHDTLPSYIEALAVGDTVYKPSVVLSYDEGPNALPDVLLAQKIELDPKYTPSFSELLRGMGGIVIFNMLTEYPESDLRRVNTVYQLLAKMSDQEVADLPALIQAKRRAGTIEYLKAK